MDLRDDVFESQWSFRILKKVTILCDNGIYIVCERQKVFFTAEANNISAPPLHESSSRTEIGTCSQTLSDSFDMVRVIDYDCPK